MRTSIFLLTALVFALVISQTHITGSTQQTAMQTIKGINFTIIFSFILYFTCELSPGPLHLSGLSERFAFAQLSPVSPIQAGLIESFIYLTEGGHGMLQEIHVFVQKRIKRETHHVYGTTHGPFGHTISAHHPAEPKSSCKPWSYQETWQGP